MKKEELLELLKEAGEDDVVWIIKLQEIFISEEHPETLDDDIEKKFDYWLERELEFLGSKGNK